MNVIMTTGLISYLKIYKRRLNDNNYFGTEYDYELKQEIEIENEEKRFQFINEEQEQIYINMKKYNLLKRVIFNIEYEKEIIVKELINLGVDISILDDEE